MKKERLDTYLVSLGYFENKSKASSAILAGDVLINDERITKAGYQINTEKEYEIRVKSMPYVSRGGFKLEKALKAFNVNSVQIVYVDIYKKKLVPSYRTQKDYDLLKQTVISVAHCIKHNIRCVSPDKRCYHCEYRDVCTSKL